MTDKKENMTRVHISFPRNLLDMLAQIEKDTGAKRAEIVRRAVINTYGEQYSEFLVEEED